MPKRSKSIKITDRKKPWLKKVKSSVYKVETEEMKKVILIVGEGQTEKLYFESFPVLTLTVKAIDLGGQSKLKLIEATQKIIKDDDIYDIIWCVFDMDVKKGEKEFSDFDNAINKGKQLGYNIGYSNDCFDLWFYLHYNYTEQESHRKFYYRELGKLWNCNYEKIGKSYDFCLSLYSRLLNDERASQQKAIENAKKLFEKQKDKVFHQQNPISQI